MLKGKSKKKTIPSNRHGKAPQVRKGKRVVKPTKFSHLHDGLVLTGGGVSGLRRHLVHPDRRRPRPLRRLPRTRKMSCQKFSRKFLHLVSRHGRDLYPISSMNVSSLFYPSVAAAEAAEVEYKNNKDVINKLGVIERIAPLPKPTICYESCSSVVSDELQGPIDVFALLGKSNILCSNVDGHTSIYDTQARAFVPMPPRDSLQGPTCIAAYITRTAAHAKSDFDVNPKVDYNGFARNPCGEHTDSLYLLDMDKDKPCCFQVLACYSVQRWCWTELPPPPFFGDPPPKNVAFAVVDGTGICVSTATATYLFDTVELEWRKAGDWVLPVHARAEYVPELRLWLGLSASRPSVLCALDLSTVTAGSCDAPPTLQHVGLNLGMPEEWLLKTRTLVNLGSGRFCIASFFRIADAQQQQVVVFTGLCVVPCGDNRQGERGLRMIKHKSKCLVTDSIKYVL